MKKFIAVCNLFWSFLFTVFFSLAALKLPLVAQENLFNGKTPSLLAPKVASESKDSCSSDPNKSILSAILNSSDPKKAAEVAVIQARSMGASIAGPLAAEIQEKLGLIVGNASTLTGIQPEKNDSTANKSNSITPSESCKKIVSAMAGSIQGACYDPSDETFEECCRRVLKENGKDPDVCADLASPENRCKPPELKGNRPGCGIKPAKNPANNPVPQPPAQPPVQPPVAGGCTQSSPDFCYNNIVGGSAIPVCCQAGEACVSQSGGKKSCVRPSPTPTATVTATPTTAPVSCPQPGDSPTATLECIDRGAGGLVRCCDPSFQACVNGGCGRHTPTPTATATATATVTQTSTPTPTATATNTPQAADCDPVTEKWCPDNRYFAPHLGECCKKEDSCAFTKEGYGTCGYPRATPKAVSEDTAGATEN